MAVNQCACFRQSEHAQAVTVKCCIFSGVSRMTYPRGANSEQTFGAPVKIENGAPFSFPFPFLLLSPSFLSSSFPFLLFCAPLSPPPFWLLVCAPFLGTRGASAPYAPPPRYATDFVPTIPSEFTWIWTNTACFGAICLCTLRPPT